MKIEGAIAERAKANQQVRKGKQPGATCQKSDNLIDTKKEAARMAGVSHDTYHKAKTVLQSEDVDEEKYIRQLYYVDPESHGIFF